MYLSDIHKKDLWIFGGINLTKISRGTDATLIKFSRGGNWLKFHLVPATLRTSSVLMPSRAKIIESSFISAMLRSRRTFFNDLGGLGGPDIRGLVDVGDQPVQLRQCFQCLLVHPGNNLVYIGERVLLVAGIVAFR